MEPDVAAGIIAAALAAGRSALDEHQSKALLAAYGIPVPESTLVESRAEAADAAARLGASWP